MTPNFQSKVFALYCHSDVTELLQRVTGFLSIAVCFYIKICFSANIIYGLRITFKRPDLALLTISTFQTTVTTCCLRSKFNSWRTPTLMPDWIILMVLYDITCECQC